MLSFSRFSRSQPTSGLNIPSVADHFGLQKFPFASLAVSSTSLSLNVVNAQTFSSFATKKAQTKSPEAKSIQVLEKKLKNERIKEVRERKKEKKLVAEERAREKRKRLQERKQRLKTEIELKKQRMREKTEAQRNKVKALQEQKKERVLVQRKFKAMRPKRTRAPYAFFFQSTVKELMKTKSSSETMPQLAKKVAGLWKTLPESEKKKYQELSEKDRERATQERRQFKERFPKRISGLALYVKENYSKMKTPNQPNTEVFGEIAKRWTGETESVKSDYKKRAAALTEKAIRAQAKFRNSVLKTAE